MRKERPEELVERPSKSQLKREMIELQALGKKIIDLPEGQRAKFPLSDDMLAAIEETHRIRSHEGLRRHMQYVGKLMRKEDLDAVRAVFEAMEQQNVRRDASFQRLERWRDRLLDDDEESASFAPQKRKPRPPHHSPFTCNRIDAPIMNTRTAATPRSAST